MGNDKAKDKEHHDWETAASSKTITSPQDACQSNGNLSQDCKAWDTTLAKTIAREIAKAHGHYQLFSVTEAQPPFKPALKFLQEQMVSRLWIPLIGLRTSLSTRDGNCGQKRLDSPLMPWKVTQKRLKSLTSITGSMEREWTH